MPFGLCNVPATLERLMDRVLGGMPWQSCLVYLDDVLVHDKTFSQAIANLDQVFGRLRQAGLKLSPEKCTLFAEEVANLGHVIGRQGVKTDPGKITAVEEWPVPTTVKQVRGFWGLCSYYRSFVANFAEIARPLHRLTEKGLRFNWTGECQEAFLKLKG